MDSKDHEKKLERLSKAITEAILRSNNVRNALQDIQKENFIGANSLLMLVMRIDGLADLVNSMQENQGKKKKVSKKGSEQFIDGKKLSKSEIQFYEYLAESFDESGWLNENRLNFD